MNLKEAVLKVAGSKYSCLESEQVDGVDVITIGHKKNERLILNYEIINESLSVNVIDKTEGKVIDEYIATFISDTEFESKVKTSVNTFEAICRTYKPAEIEKVEEVIEVKTETPDIPMNDRFADILENGKVEELEQLSPSEIEALDVYAAGINAPKFVRSAIQNQIKKMKDREPVVDVLEGPESDELEKVVPEVGSFAEDALVEATMPQLLEAFIECLSNRIDIEDDEIVSRVLEDISAQAEGMLDELSQVILG